MSGDDDRGPTRLESVLTNRRDLLKVLAAAGGVGAIGLGIEQLTSSDQTPPGDGNESVPTSDSSGTQSPPTDSSGTVDDQDEPDSDSVRHADDFETVVDAVQAGADPTGQEPITDVLVEHAVPGTLLSFPPGDYRLEPLKLEGRIGFGIAAATEERPRFLGVEGVCRDRPYLWFEGGRDYLFDGINLDFTQAGTGGEVRFMPERNATVQNVTISGSCEGQIALFRMDVLATDGEAVVRNLRATQDENSHLTGFFVGSAHAGTLTFEDCHVNEFSDNGLYASPPGADDARNGVVRVVGGTYTNNNIANVRLGSTGSTARDVFVKVDQVPSSENVNTRGIRLRYGRDIKIEDCRVEFGRAATKSFGAIVVHGDNEGATVKDTHVRVDASKVPAIHAFEPNQSVNDRLVFENVTIDGNAEGSFAATIFGRDGTTFRNCTIKQNGRNRGGIRLVNATDCQIVDCVIETDRTPVAAPKTDVLIQNTTIATPDGVRHIDTEILDDADLNPQ